MTEYYITIRAWRDNERGMMHTKIHARNDDGARTYALWWLQVVYPTSVGWSRRAYTLDGADWSEVD